ncbi:amino acid adenylation domain-containing protein [Actinoplanes sp. Pm04-4]|uniref:Amino acid adenylation domain-containing protein n=1 Tax=Paractinoplanes pyxinae TaxID=2997416 RepID=A0ABT4BC50_9ACTN|nr:amino acid adenylation domain-containing protein [Actinoplanes pyxinae]MCY1144099.1 amino acid adenylation domain-containing protein [Actinoplanes pyxinae]
MTPAQTSIWLSEHLRPGTARYVESLAFRLTGPVTPDLVGRCFAALVDRYDVFRSSYRLHDGQVRRTPVDGYEPDFRSRPIEVDAEAEAIREFLTEPMNLTAGEVARALLLSPSSREHILVLAFHHVVVDEWTFGLIIEELGEMLSAAIAGRMPRLPDAVGVASPRPEPGEPGHWQVRLDGAPLISTMPTDRPRPTAPTATGGQVSLGLGDSVRRLTRALRTTPVPVLFAAAYVLLSRHTGQNDLVVGMPWSSRNPPATDRVAGCFIDMLPIRQDLSGAPSFADLVRQVAAEIGESSRNGVSYARLAQEISDLPRCQVVATVGEREVPLLVEGLHTERLRPHNGTAKYDLFLQMIPDGAGHLGLLEYSADLFDHQTAERFLARLSRLLDSAAIAPGTSVNELEILTPFEADLVARVLPTGPVADRPSRRLHEHFEAQAALTPEAPAVIRDREQMTYGELERRADRLARVLRARGAAGAVVGILLDRSFELAISVLAVLKAGAAYLPLDPAYPLDRLDFMLRDSRVELLLADGDVSVSAPVSVISTRTDAPQDTASGGDGRLAYVIYTSGSTGMPKGIAMPQAVLDNLVSWQLGESTHGSGRTLQYSALSFDVSCQEMFSTWAAGGVLVLVDEKDRTDPARLLDILTEHRVERLFLPYAGLQHLATYCAAAQRYPSTLREVITAGEALIVTDSIRAMFQRCAGATLTNQYGPSETHVVTARTLNGDPRLWPTNPDIGFPIANTRVHLVDQALRPVPPGAVGELLVGGVAVADGYLHRPEATNERFVADPWEPSDTAMSYRTGDLGRFRADGSIEFLGRSDGQIKIRGYRVEPGEIEHLLTTVTGVDEAAVVVRPTSMGAQLAAYVRAAELDPQSLRAELASRLPAYMVPQTITVIEAFPLTPSGKIDRRELAARQPETPGTAGSRRPRDRVEIELCELWSRVLGLPEVGIDDDFFDLGGSSFSGVQLVAMIRLEMGQQVELPTLYQASTVALLAEALRDGEQPTRTASLVKLRDGDRGVPPIFCFHALPGSVVRFGVFKSLLRPGRPIYGLQARGLDPRQPPHTDVVEMAGDYLREIREAFPDGPYVLFGYSLGGVIAYETARQLQADGADVALLALGDTDSVWDFESTRGDVLEHLVTKALKLDLDVAELAAMSGRERVQRILDAGIAGGALSRDFGLDRLRRMLEMYETNATAVATYQVRPYAGDLLLLRAEQAPSAPDDLGWGRFARSVQVEWVPGDHFHMLEPQAAAVLADILDRQLEHQECR